MRTGEKIMIRGKTEIIRPCGLIHPDFVPVRTSDLTVNLDRPPHKEKSIVIRTGGI